MNVKKLAQETKEVKARIERLPNIMSKEEIEDLVDDICNGEGV